MNLTNIYVNIRLYLSNHLLCDFIRKHVVMLSIYQLIFHCYEDNSQTEMSSDMILIRCPSNKVVWSDLCVRSTLCASAAPLSSSSHQWYFVAPSIYFITRAPDILGSVLIFGES